MYCNYIEIYCKKCSSFAIVYKHYTKEEFDKRFLFALNALNDDYKKIIKKIYIEKDIIWWVDYYSKSTYYRLRARALNTLFTILNALLWRKFYY